MLTHHFSKKALGSLKGHSASMKYAKLYDFKISTFSTILDWKLQWFGWEKYCADHKSEVFTPFQCEFLQNISDLIIFNINWPNVGVGLKNMQNKFFFLRFVPQNKWKTCLIWSFLAKMERWQDVTSLSWVHLMLEIKYHKAMIACLSCLSRSVDSLVDRQWLWHCCEELLVLEREEERHWLVAALWKSRLRPHPGWTLQEPNRINRSPDPACPQPGPYRTTNKLKLCHISNFLLALLYLLNLLKQCADCVSGYKYKLRACMVMPVSLLLCW